MKEKLPPNDMTEDELAEMLAGALASGFLAGYIKARTDLEGQELADVVSAILKESDSLVQGFKLRGSVRGTYKLVMKKP